MKLAKLFIITILIAVLLFQINLALFNKVLPSKKDDPIPVGLVFSTTGPMSLYDFPIQESVLMAIEEINQNGGINGRNIEPILRDAESKDSITFQIINELIDKKVAAIFGGRMEGKVKDVSTLLKNSNTLLFSPYRYEGISESDNIIHLGISAYQQAAPAVNFSFENLGKQFVLIGTDSLYSRVTHSIIRELVEARNGKVIGEYFITDESSNLKEIIQQTVLKKPSVIISTLKDNNNTFFFEELKKLNSGANKIPVISFYLNEIDLKVVNDIRDYEGHYAVWNYFQSIDSEMNKKFVDDFLSFSKLKVTNNDIEAGYNSVKIWGKALKESKKTDASSLLKVFRSLQLQAPEGSIAMTMNGLYAWKPARIGKINENRAFDVVWTSEETLRPIPYHFSETEKNIPNSFINPLPNSIREIR